MRKVSIISILSLILLLSSWGIGLSKTPTLLSGGLISTVRSLKLPVEIEYSLLEKLEVAKVKLTSSNASRFKSAVNNLKAFKNQVNALKSKFLTTNQADALLRQAQNLIDLVNNTTAKTIGISGGFVEVRDPSSPIYGAFVSIPRGALDSDTLIMIVEETSPRPVSTNVTPCSPVVRFGPEGLIFKKPVTVAVPVKADCIHPKIYTSDLEGGTFEKVAKDPDSSQGLLITEVNHFSNFQAGSETGNPGAPYFDWTILLNVTFPIRDAIGKMAHMNAHVVHPECNDPSDFYCIPDRIKSIRVTTPSGFEYNFIKGDYWFDVYHRTLNDFYGMNLKYHWYYAHKRVDDDMTSGEYKFEMTYLRNGIEESHSITRNLVTNPIPIVDRSTVQICRQMDETGSCLQWSPADFFEGISTNQTLKIRWDPIFYEGGPVYYQVRISNWMDGPPIYRSMLTTDTELTIPAELINRILIENSTYIMRIWAFDDVTIPNSYNRSHSSNIRFATGNVSFENYPILVYGRVLRSNFPFENYPFEVIYAAQVRNGLNGEVLTKDDVRVFAYKPNDEIIELKNWTAAGDVWEIVTQEQPLGEYIFKAVLKNDQTKEVNLRDYFNRARSLPIPELLSPEHNALLPPQKPTFTWLPVDGAKTYELLLEKGVGGGNNWIWQRILTASWIGGTEFTLPFDLGPGVYQWRIRAYDSFGTGTIDNRSNSFWRIFTVQVP